jgi:hypothetical protein
VNGRRVDFFDVQRLADEVLQALEHRETTRPLVHEALQRVRRYDAAAALAGYDELIRPGTRAA